MGNEPSMIKGSMSTLNKMNEGYKWYIAYLYFAKIF